MKSKVITTIMITLFLASMLSMAFNMAPVAAETNTLYIGSDYTFTSDIYEEIVVTADNIVIDGKGYTLQGTGTGFGFYLYGRSGVTIKNVIVKRWTIGIYLSGYDLYSSGNTISGNTVSSSSFGIDLFHSSDNTISGNTVSKNGYGMSLWYSSGNTISGNTVSSGWWYGMHLLAHCSDNLIYHNNIIGNAVQAYDTNPADNDWHHPDLLEGNYWSDYPGVDDGSGTGKHSIAGDGIGDTNIPWPGPDYDYYPFIHESGWIISPPTADFTYSPVSPDEGSVVSFTDASTDVDGTIVSWSWSFGDGGTSTLQNPTHAFGDNGVYTVSLTVTDNDGLTDTKTTDVTVNNFAPTVDAGPDQTVTAGDTVSFSGSFTDPGLLDTHTYSWDCGDGTVVTDTLTPTHVYPDAGVYTVYLQVTDDDGGVGTDTLVVTVNPIPATINIDPDTLKSKSKGKWITCYIELPEGYDVYDIDLSSIKLWYDGGFVSAESDPKYDFVTDPSVYITDVDGDGILERMVKFDRSEVITLLGGALGDVIFTVTGKIAGADFSGADTIRVI